MKALKIIIALNILLIFTGTALAEEEVNSILIEATGSVSLKINGVQTSKLQSGIEIPEGSIIETGTNGNAVILYADGVIQKIMPNKKLIMTTDAPAKETQSVIRGISIAIHEMKQSKDMHTVPAMVKAPSEEFEMTPARKEWMERDLAEIDRLSLNTETGKELLKVQIYYKYRQYKKMLEILLKIYKSQTPPSDTVRGLIVLAYEKLGKPDEADKYRK